MEDILPASLPQALRKNQQKKKKRVTVKVVDENVRPRTKIVDDASKKRKTPALTKQQPLSNITNSVGHAKEPSTKKKTLENIMTSQELAKKTPMLDERGKEIEKTISESTKMEEQVIINPQEMGSAAAKDQEEADHYLSFLHDLRVSQSILESYENQVITCLQKQIAILHKERTRLLALNRKGPSQLDGLLNIKQRLRKLKKRVETLKGKLTVYQQSASNRHSSGEKFAYPKGLNPLFVKAIQSPSPSERDPSTPHVPSPLSQSRLQKHEDQDEISQADSQLGRSAQKNRRKSYSAPHPLDVAQQSLIRKNLMSHYSGQTRKVRTSLLFDTKAEPFNTSSMAPTTSASTTTTPIPIPTEQTPPDPDSQKKSAEKFSGEIVRALSLSQKKIEQKRLSDLGTGQSSQKTEMKNGIIPTDPPPAQLSKSTISPSFWSSVPIPSSKSATFDTSGEETGEPSDDEHESDSDDLLGAGSKKKKREQKDLQDSIRVHKVTKPSPVPTPPLIPPDLPGVTGDIFDPDADPLPVKDDEPPSKRAFQIPLISTSIFECLTGHEVIALLPVCKDWAKVIKESPLMQRSLTQTDKGMVYSVMQQREEKFKLGDYLHKQPQINAKMRAILVDWMADVSLEFRHSDETLHLAVRLIDRLLESVPVPRRELQLVGCASILIAAKIEEIYPPSIDTLLYLCDNIYTRDQILQMEAVVLEKLQFSFQCPTAWTFMQHFFKAFSFTDEAKFFSHFLVELSLQEYELVKYPPSCVATTIACLALYSTSHQYHPLLTLSGYAPVDIIPVARSVKACLDRQRQLIFSRSNQTETEGDPETEAPLLMSTMEKFASAPKLRVSKLAIKPKFEEDIVRLYGQ